MTPSLPAQIAALRRAIETRDHQSEQFELARYDAEALRAALAALQQHERLEAALRSAPVMSMYHGHRGFEVERFITDYETWRKQCRAALDTAAPDKPEDAERERDG